MTAEMTASESLGPLFITALLLTGHVPVAEATMLRGLEWLDDPDTASNEELLRTAVIASQCLDSRKMRQPHRETERDSSFLPRELQDVLELPDGLRQCFVLRILRAMPREWCARLLGLDAAAVDRNTAMAAQSLAEVSLNSRS